MENKFIRADDVAQELANTCPQQGPKQSRSVHRQTFQKKK